MTIFVRCVVAYRDKTNEHGGTEFTRFCPKQIKDLMDEVKIETNPLAYFIQNGDDRYQVINKPGAFTTLTQLSMVFSKHMLHVHKRAGVSIGKDYHAITSAGYRKEKKNFCKECGVIDPTRGKCGSHYNKNNKSAKIGFMDMDIITVGYQQ